MNRIEYDPFRGEFPPSPVDLPKLKGSKLCKCKRPVREGTVEIQTQGKDGSITKHLYRRKECGICLKAQKNKNWYPSKRVKSI